MPALILDSDKNPSLKRNTDCSFLSPIKPSIKLRRSVTEFPKNFSFNYLSLFIPALKGEAFIYVTLRELGEPFVIIDVRALYFESGFKILAESILAEEFIRKLKEYKGLFEKLGDKLVELISRIESISAGPLEIKVKKNIYSCF